MGIGFTEMLIVAAVALVFLGPQKFPGFAKMAVRTFRDLRSYMDDVKEEVTKEILPVKKELTQLSRYDAETYINKLMDDDEDKGADPLNADVPSDKTGDAEHQPQTETAADPAEEAPASESSGDTHQTSGAQHESVQPPERMDG